MAGTPKLIVLSSQIRGKQFELTKDLYTVGRVDERDICLKDASVSSHHCDLIKTGDFYTVKDNGSTNGTRVNNVPVTEQELHNSDIIQFGSVEVLYDADIKSSSSTTTTQKTVTGITIADIDPAAMKLMTASVEPEKKADKKIQYIFVGIIGVLVLILLGLGFYLANVNN